MRILWRPISEIPDKYDSDLLLCAPELVDLDCNVHGIGMGHWQDGEDWLCAKWSMTNDEWYTALVNPTHFIVMEGSS